MHKLSYGEKAPDIINVVIEIQHGGRNKYEYDKELGVLVLDRVNATRLGYPADYGYVPNTLCEDGDPIDALVVIDESIPYGVMVPCRPVGVLYMVDDGERDEKLICVAADDITKDHIKELEDLGENFMHNVQHFYAHYKDFKNDWKGADVTFNGWGGADEARVEVQKAIELAKTRHAGLGL